MSNRVDSAEVQARKTALLYRNAAFGQLVNISVSALVAFIGYISRPGPIILVWWLLMLGLAIVRYRMSRSYAAAQPGPAGSEGWSARYVRTTALASLLWLLGGGLIMWGNSDGYRFLTALALAGMVAGAVPVLSAVKVAFRVYAIPILGGVALISFAGASTPVDWAFGMMALVFLAGVLRSADFLHDALAESMAQGLDLETTGDGYWRVSKDGRLVDVNSAYCRYSGYTRDELLTMKFHELELPGTSGETTAHIHKVLEAGSDLFETRHRRKDGSIWHVEVRATVSRASDPGFSVFLRDISERKSFEQKLLHSREQLRQFLDHFPGTAYLKNGESRFLLANMGFKSRIGLEPSAIVGCRSDELFAGDYGKKIVADDKRILKAGKTEILEETFEGRYLESIKFVIMQGEERLLGGITVDVTPRVRSRMRTEALLALTERGGVLEERELLRFGLEKAEEITSSGIGFLHLVNEDQATIELGTWTDGALNGCEVVHDRHSPISGAGIWADCFRLRGAAICNDYDGYAAKKGLPPGHAKLDRLISVPVLEAGKVRMMLGVGNKASDYDEFDVQSLQLIGNDLWRIVRRARAEQALKDRLEEITTLNRKFEQSQDQLLQSEKMATIGQLAAGVAHELNNPIGFVQSNLGTLSEYVCELLEIVAHSEQCAEHCSVPGRLESLRRIMEQKDFDFLKDDVRQLIAESKDGADRVRRIVQNLKDFSHVSEDEWQWTDLHKGLESTLTLVWNEIKYKAEVEKSYGELPEVFCVASQLNQVFMNLLVNAAQAIETRGKISIATGVIPAAPEQEAKVWIEIRDTGKGIPEEHLKRIFEPFFTTKPVGKGTGLGLSLAWGIVHKHRGSIEVHSVVGEGSSFRLVLPVNANPDTKEATT